MYGAGMHTPMWYPHIYVSESIAEMPTIDTIVKDIVYTDRWTQIKNLTLEEFCLMSEIPTSLWCVYYNSLDAIDPYDWVCWQLVPQLRRENQYVT
jgi:hypothetical protein